MKSVLPLLLLLKSLPTFAEARAFDLYNIRWRACLGAALGPVNEYPGDRRGFVRYLNVDLPWGTQVYLQQFVKNCYTPETGETICGTFTHRVAMQPVGAWLWEAPISVSDGSYNTWSETISLKVVTPSFTFVELGIPNNEGFRFPFMIQFRDGGTNKLEPVRIVPPEGYETLSKLGACSASAL